MYYRWLLLVVLMFTTTVDSGSRAALSEPIPLPTNSWVKRFQNLADTDPQLMALQITVKLMPGAKSPLQLQYRDGKCTVFVDVDNIETQKQYNFKFFWDGAFVHEAMHCKHGKDGSLAFIERFKDRYLERRRPDDLLTYDILSNKEEAVADIAALVWVATYHPAKFEQFKALMLHMRESSAALQPHDTIRYIRKLDRKQLITSGNIFAHAEKIIWSME